MKRYTYNRKLFFHFYLFESIKDVILLLVFLVGNLVGSRVDREVDEGKEYRRSARSCAQEILTTRSASGLLEQFSLAIRGEDLSDRSPHPRSYTIGLTVSGPWCGSQIFFSHVDDTSEEREDKEGNRPKTEIKGSLWKPKEKKKRTRLFFGWLVGLSRRIPTVED